MKTELNIEQRWDLNSILLHLKNEDVDEENKVVKIGFGLFEPPMEDNTKHGTCYNGYIPIPIHDAEVLVIKLQKAIDDFYKFDESYANWCAEQDISKF